MIFVVAFWAMCLPLGAACGRVYAYTNEIEDLELWSFLAAIITPIGIFCAINILMQDINE